MTGVAISPASASAEVGGTATFTADVTPDNATDTSGKWSVDDNNVATVAGGVITAKGAGAANVTFTTNDGGFTDTASLTVTDPASSSSSAASDAPASSDAGSSAPASDAS